jgi:glycosyltransferase involved in cell wall biosynthesis
LAKRGENRYGLTFFDYGGEAGNRRFIDEYFGDLKMPIYECNTLNYRDAFIGQDSISYEECTGAKGDVFHFMHYIKFPENIRGIPVITIHDTLPLTHPEWFEPRIAQYARIFAERIRRRRPLLLANSQCTKKDVLENIGVSEEDIVVIPHAYDSETCFPESNPFKLKEMGIDSTYLLYMGPIDGRKNIPVLLDAFQIISKRFYDVKLVIAGITDSHSGNAVYCKIRDFPDSERLVLLGQVSDEQRRILLSGAIAFIFPSLYEGFGIPVLEAFACGCPVITSNTSALPEIAGNAAILVNPYNSEEIAHQIERLIDDNTLWIEMRNKGLKIAQASSWQNTAALTELAYEFSLIR